jgi:hypothetical protein
MPGNREANPVYSQGFSSAPLIFYARWRGNGTGGHSRSSQETYRELILRTSGLYVVYRDM